MHHDLLSAPGTVPVPDHDPPSLLVTGLRLRFDNIPLFENFSLNIIAGGWTCLLGTSGIGKTTLLRAIAGLIPLPAADGTICAGDGRPLEGRIAYMAQQDLLLPWLNLTENLLLGRRLRREPVDRAARDQARRHLEAVGLGDHAHLRPAQLSGGMRQRAALARTLFEQRPVVLMDEPFSAVDAITRQRLQELAARLLRGRTVLLVTHDPLEALRLGDTVFVLAGRPPQSGPAITPPGSPPRPLASLAGLADLHARVLERLALGEGEGEGMAESVGGGK